MENVGSPDIGLRDAALPKMLNCKIHVSPRIPLRTGV